MAGNSFESTSRTTSSNAKEAGRSRSTGAGSKRSNISKSNKPSNHSKTRAKTRKPAGKAALDRPFDKKIWAAAEKMASEYQLVITREPEVGFFGRTVEMPFVMGDGTTIEICAAETLAATTLAVAVHLELGENPPSPARAGKRDQQVNIRLTAEEKMQLEAAARNAGFRTLSDYLRASGLNRAG